MGKIRIGVVGTGYTVGMANGHVNAYLMNEDVKSVALFDIVPGRTKKWVEDFKLDDKKIIHCESFEKLLENSDGVSVVTSNYAHVSLAIKVLEAGKHVLCEKPLSLNSKEAEKLIKYAKSTDVVNMIRFNYRSIPAIRYMKDIISSKKLGRIFTYRETLGGGRIADPEVGLEWRMQKDLSGTGALADFGSHCIDLCDWLIADVAGDIKEVSAMLGTAIKSRKDLKTGELKKVTNDDYSSFNLRFSDDTIASFVTSRLGVFRHTIEIYGSGGMLFFNTDEKDKLEVVYKSTDGGYDTKQEKVDVPAKYLEEYWYNTEMNEFVDSIINSKTPDRSLERGYYIQKIVDAVELSDELKKTIELKIGG